MNYEPKKAMTRTGALRIPAQLTQINLDLGNLEAGNSNFPLGISIRFKILNDNNTSCSNKSRMRLQHYLQKLLK